MGYYSIANKDLKVGSKGAQVKWLQSQLRVVGHEVKIDGVFGIRTQTEVRAFQSANELTVDGIVGAKTREKLVQKAMVENAYIIGKFMLATGMHYADTKHRAKATFDEARKQKNQGCTCGHYVSWVAQMTGILKTGKTVTHSKANSGIGEKAVLGANKLLGCIMLYPNKKIVDMLPLLHQGDILVWDSSIGIYDPYNSFPRVMTARSGKATLDESGKYKNLTIDSMTAYEFKNPVLAVIRVK